MNMSVLSMSPDCQERWDPTAASRMRRRSLALLTALIVLSGALETPATPKIQVVGSATHDFGKYPASEQKNASFVIRNDGDEVLRIVKVRKTCGCSSADADCTEVKSGQTCSIHVSIHADSVAGQYAKNVYVESSDPTKRFLRLVVKGDAVQLVEVIPKSQMYAGRLPLNEEWQQTFELKEHLGQVTYGTAVVESGYPVDVQLTPRTGTNAFRSLAVTLRPPATSGDWRCSITVPVLEPPSVKPIEVKITAKIGKALFALPTAVQMKKSGAGAAAEFKLRLASPANEDVNPKLLEWPQLSGVSWHATKTQKHDLVDVAATFSAEFLARLGDRRKIVMQIGYPDAASAALECLFLD